MDSEVLFVTPADVFLSPFDVSTKSPNHVILDQELESDEKFLNYNSSPESLGSYTDESTLSLIEDDGSLGVRNILDAIQQRVVPYHAQIDPPATCPITLNPLEQSLIMTYLTDYAETVYQFRSEMRPHPMAILLSTAMTNPACLHLILARSAQYRLMYNNQCNSIKQQQELEVAMIHHKCEAIQMIRNLSTDATHGQPSEDLMAAIIGLGRLDQFSGAEDTASMHFGAARQLIKDMGDPTHMQSIWFLRTTAHFECNHSLATQSYVWDRSDFGRLHMELNRFLGQVWSVDQPMSPPPNTRKRKSMQGQLSPTLQQHKPLTAIKPDSILLQCLTRQLENPSEPTHQDRLELISQLTCLLILCTVLVDYRSNQPALQAYVDTVQDLVINDQLQNQSSNNLMWLLQIHDHSEMHSKRVWAATGWIWILRHVSFNVQSMVKEWLIAILTSKCVTRKLKLDPFAFSYAS